MAKRKGKRDAFEGPSPHDRRRLGHLPQTIDVWQVDARPVPATAQEGDRAVQPWMIVVASRSRGHILAYELVREPPAAGQVWRTLFQAMTAPAAGEPCRPTEVQVRPQERFVPLHAVLADLGIDFTATRALDQMDAVFEGLAKELTGHQQPGLLDMPGTTPVGEKEGEREGASDQGRDYLLDVLHEQWDSILHAYKQLGVTGRPL